MTATETEPITKHVLWFKPADSLIRALSNGLLFAGTNMTLPALAAIKFEFDGTRLEALSTDRYRACIEEVQLDPSMSQEGQPPFQFLLPRDAAKAALAFLKSNRRDVITLNHDAVAATVQFSANGSVVEYRVIDNAFPALRGVFPTPANKSPVSDIGFNAKYLADFGKVVTGEKYEAVKVSFFGGSAERAKPILAEYVDGPRVVYMPYKIPAA